jgi:hypothetical protein
MNSDGTENDSEAEQGDDRIGQSFVRFFTGDGVFLDDGDLPALNREDFAGTAILLPENLHQTVTAKCFGAADATVHGGNVGVIFALHGTLLRRTALAREFSERGGGCQTVLRAREVARGTGSKCAQRNIQHSTFNFERPIAPRRAAPFDVGR